MNMRLNMNSNLKVLLSAVGVVALVVSPALAKPRHHQDVTRTLAHVPSDAHAGVGAYAPAPSAQTVYAPDVRVPAQSYELNPDFQLSGRGVKD
jgi:hypothetical protein